jgi:hypothetical protein
MFMQFLPKIIPNCVLKQSIHAVVIQPPVNMLIAKKPGTSILAN